MVYTRAFYSRLYLIVESPRILHALLVVILGMGTHTPSNRYGSGWRPYFRHEYGCCLRFVTTFLSDSCGNVQAPQIRTKRAFYFLAAAEIAVIIMDVIGNTLWYMDLYRF